MKIAHVLLFGTFIACSALAYDFGYLKPEDQKYFKNDVMEGRNDQERTDMTVREINKLHGEIARMKKDIDALKLEVEALKKK
jgi:hypothetical protein